MTSGGHDTSSGPDADAVRRLSLFVEGEAKRMLTEEQIAGNPELIAQGWERRFLTDRRRAEEMVELYRELGKEVRMEAVRPEEFGEDCGDCQLLRFHFCMVYTRDRPAEGTVGTKDSHRDHGDKRRTQRS